MLDIITQSELNEAFSHINSKESHHAKHSLKKIKPNTNVLGIYGVSPEDIKLKK